MASFGRAVGDARLQSSKDEALDAIAVYDMEDAIAAAEIDTTNEGVLLGRYETACESGMAAVDDGSRRKAPLRATISSGRGCASDPSGIGFVRRDGQSPRAGDWLRSPRGRSGHPDDVRDAVRDAPDALGRPGNPRENGPTVEQNATRTAVEVVPAGRSVRACALVVKAIVRWGCQGDRRRRAGCLDGLRRRNALL